jgi:hypothetical protein
MLLSGFEKQTYLIEVLDNIDMMFWIKSKSNNLLYVNKNALRKIFGVDDPQDIYKKECPLSCKFSESITKKEDVIEKIEVDGKSMWLNCKRIPIKDDGVLVIAEDITEPGANDIVFEKNQVDHGQWWGFISSEQHRYHNNSYEKAFEKKKTEETFRNFLNTHRKYRWIFEGQVVISGPHPKFDIHVENKTILYNSLYILLNNQSFDGSGIKLKKIRDDQ